MRLVDLLVVMVLLAIPTTILAARSTVRMEVKPQASSAELDSSPPVITISSPDIKRGLKVVAREAGLTVTGRATDGSGIASVSVNGVSARLDELGNFSADILLKPGENQVTVVALDTAGNRGTERLSVNRTATAVAAAPLAERGKNYALVVGINDYRHISKLKTAVNDAETVARILKDDYGFSATLLLDGQATRAAMLKELNAVKNRLNPEDRLLIYYAGHGWNDKDTETSYWLPVDAEPSDPTNWVEAKSITDQLKRSQARQVLVVADSCYSGTISRSFDPLLKGGGARESYLKKMMEKPARVLFASGGNEPVSDSGGSGHSIFADVFIRALRSPFDRRFTAEELMTRQIKESVAGRSDQTPEYKVIRNSGHDGGDFVFVKIR
jgi:uncharacterized caspase-like protein